MIPVKLTLNNFLCYGDSQTVDFSGIHLACLAGDNGAGKTALLDAITWALWGKCRAKTEDEVVQIGQTEAAVEFEFYSGEQLYRVVRKRRRRGNRPGSTILELQAEYGGSFRSETESSVPATERKIIDSLKMDYDTFINSAFLIQGRADLFTVKTPDERKRVLSDILGLDRYEKLEARARELMRQREAETRGAERELEEMRKKLEGRRQAEADRDQIQSTLHEIAQEIQVHQEIVNGLRERKRSLDDARNQLIQTQGRLQRAQQQRRQAHEQAEEHKAIIARCESTLRDATDIRAGYAELQVVRAEARKAAQQQDRWVELNTRRTETLAVIDRALNQLQSREERLVGESRKQDEQRNRAGELAAELSTFEQQEASLDEQRTKLASRREQEQHARSGAQTAREAVVRLKEEITQIDTKLRTLELAEEAECPVCGQPLGEVEREALLRNLKEERKAKLDQAKEQNQSTQTLTAIADRHKQEAQRVEAALQRDESRIRSRIAWLQNGMVQAAEAEKNWALVQKELDEVRLALDNRTYARTEQDALARLDESLQLLGYDHAAHSDLKERLEHLEAFEASYRELAKAEQALEQASLALKRDMEYHEERDQQCHELETDIAALQGRIAEDADLEPQLKTAESNLNATERRRADQQQALGAVEQQLEYLADLAQGVERKEEESKTFILEYSIYKELADAFSRLGVQALIIDSVLPELEQEANDLLSRMSGGQMHLTISTQRETQRGTVRETLDIRISDNFGTRSYEMFSGGEAFRINFALRVALSKLLARRAGAPLRTLIIDEGFGTQDASGRERLVEALSAVQNDFDCVLAITHIDEIRDEFPVKIMVEKGTRGSSVSVSVAA